MPLVYAQPACSHLEREQLVRPDKVDLQGMVVYRDQPLCGRSVAAHHGSPAHNVLHVRDDAAPGGLLLRRRAELPRCLDVRGRNGCAIVEYRVRVEVKDVRGGIGVLVVSYGQGGLGLEVVTRDEGRHERPLVPRPAVAAAHPARYDVPDGPRPRHRDRLVLGQHHSRAKRPGALDVLFIGEVGDYRPGVAGRHGRKIDHPLHGLHRPHHGGVSGLFGSHRRALGSRRRTACGLRRVIGSHGRTSGGLGRILGSLLGLHRRCLGGHHGRIDDLLDLGCGQLCRRCIHDRALYGLGELLPRGYTGRGSPDGCLHQLGDLVGANAFRHRVRNRLLDQSPDGGNIDLGHLGSRQGPDRGVDYPLHLRCGELSSCSGPDRRFHISPRDPGLRRGRNGRLDHPLYLLTARAFGHRVRNGLGHGSVHGVADELGYILGGRSRWRRRLIAGAGQQCHQDC